MVDAKTPLSTKTTVSSVDKVAAIRNDGTGDKVVLIEVDNLAAQMSFSGGGGILKGAWTDGLEDVVGTYAGQPARVIGDSGTHTDPVTGAVGVDNDGEYGWSTSPAGWERIGDLPPGIEEIDAAVAAEAVIRSAADANLQSEIDAISNLPAGIEVALDINTDPPLEWYDTGARIAAVPTTRAFLSNKRPIDMASTVHWVDFADKSTIFQDAALSTPVENDGDPVYGFIAKDNVGTFLETVALTNPLFDTDLTGWTLASGSGGTAAWNAEKARITRTTTATSIQQSIALTAGRLYTITAAGTWISGASAQCSIVLRSGASASATSKAVKSLAAGASGQIVLTYVPSADETVYLHLTCAGGAGVVDIDTVAVSAGDRAVFTAVDPTALGTWRVRHGKGYLAANEGSETKVGYVCSQIHGLGASTFQGGVCIGYRQRKPQTGAFVWTSSLIAGDGNTASLQSFVGTGDRFTVAGSGTVLSDRGLRDKAAYLWWNRNLLTSRGGRTKETLSTVAIGSDSDDTSFYLFVRGSGSGAAVDVYDLTIIDGSITDEDRDWLCDYTNARANVRYPTQINVILAHGQSNSDMRAALSDGAAPAGWNDDKILPGVWNWNGSEISDTYWFYPVGSTQCGGSWVDGQAGASKFGFIDVAVAQMAETIPNLVVCRVTQGGTGVDTSTNTNGSWHTPSSALDADTPSLFDAAKNKFLALQAFCDEHAIRLNVLGMFWHQGENAKAAPTNFKVDTEAVFAGVREFVGDEDLPIVTGTIPTGSAYYSLAVKNDMLAIDAADDRVTYLDFSALTMSDGTHFDAASNVTAGGLAADEMLDYVGDSYLIPSGSGSVVGAGFPDLGDGVATALVQDIGAAGGLVAGGGALGTPASGNLENCNGLPLSGISDFGAGVAAALAHAPRTIDARTFGVVGDPMTTARASLTDNTAALQSIITYVKSLTSTTGLSSIHAEVPIMTIVDLPPGYVGITAATLVWQIPPHTADNGYIDIHAAVIVDCDNIVFRGNGTVIVHKDPGALSGYAPAFATHADRDLVCGTNPITTFSGLTRIKVTCTEPHRLETGDVLLVGGTMTTANGVSAAMIAGYQIVAFTTITAYEFSFYYTGSNASASGAIGGSSLTFKALRSVRNIGFIGDLTFDLTKPAEGNPSPGGIYLLGVNHAYIEGAFRSALFGGRLIGHGVQACNCRGLQFGDKCTFTTMAQAIGLQYCDVVTIGDVTLRNVNEGIDFDHVCTNVRIGHLLGVFDDPFPAWPDASRAQQQRQLLDFSDIKHCYVASITALNYWEVVYCYSKNYWSHYHEWLENAGTSDNLNQPAFSDVTIGDVRLASDETGFDDDYRAIMISWNQSSNINLVLGTDPFTTTNGSAVVACVVGEAHDFQIGDTVTFGGTIADVGGLTSGNISGARTIAAVTDTTHFTFTAGASATSGATGGGSAVTATTPHKGIEDVPQPTKINIGSITTQRGGYIEINGVDAHIGSITVDDPLGTGAPIRVGSTTVTLSGGGTLTMPTRLTCGPIRVNGAAGPALTLSGTYDAEFGSINVDGAVAALSLSGAATSQASFGPITIANDTGLAMSIGGSGSYAFGPITLNSCTTGLTISSSPLVRFGGPIHIPSTTTPVGSVSITARLAAHSYTVPLGAVVATASILDKPIFGLRTGEGAFVVQGWLSNVSAITGDGTNYATVQLINSSSSGATRIGGAPINYGDAAISAGAATALQGNGTDTDGRLAANQMVAVRFIKAGTGQTFPELVASLDAIRYTV